MLEKKPTQCQRIVKYIQDFGAITSFEAYRELGITQLGARVFELKRQGYKFKTTFKADKNRYGDPIKYKIYSLEKEENDGKLQAN